MFLQVHYTITSFSHVHRTFVYRVFNIRRMYKCIIVFKNLLKYDRCISEYTCKKEQLMNQFAASIERTLCAYFNRLCLFFLKILAIQLCWMFKQSCKSTILKIFTDNNNFRSDEQSKTRIVIEVRELLQDFVVLVLYPYLGPGDLILLENNNITTDIRCFHIKIKLF